jgi:hypothetical protein
MRINIELRKSKNNKKNRSNLINNKKYMIKMRELDPKFLNKISR